ncbi:MAG TPA: hypothetical protein VLW65_17145 [Bryobacteraceae bacterium]|nr:hypothetical protein [Bryobacteraceae bacterium]
MLDAGALIQKHHAKGVLVDTNLLILFLVGTVNKRRIPEFKRTQDFTIEDFELVLRLVEWFGKVVATPHILSQVSDLAVLRGRELHAIRCLLRSTVEQIEEIYDPSSQLVTGEVFERLGLTDAAIAAVCSRGKLVLTADVELQLTLQRCGGDALNFNHVRQLAWALNRQ